MKALIITIGAILLAIFFNPIASRAQNGLEGSGKIVTLNPTIKDFDKVYTSVNAKTIITIGKPWAIDIEADDNLAQYIKTSLEPREHVLNVTFEVPRPKKNDWLQNANIVIRISMPQISVYKQTSNSNAEITGLIGRYLRIENLGNGNVIATGTQMDILDLVLKGNGEIDTKGLKTDKAEVTLRGNGSIELNADKEMKAALYGNGAIKNIGKALNKTAPIKGNGSITDVSSVWKKNSYNYTADDEMNEIRRQKMGPGIPVKFKNNGILPRNVVFITYDPADGGANGTRGVMMMPGGTQEFTVMDGTKFYLANSEQVDVVMGGGKLTNTPPFVIIAKADSGKSFNINK